MGFWIVLSIVVASSILASGRSEENLIAILLLNGIALSMIFRPSWWTFWLPFGFWEQFARDKHQADMQGPVFVFIGWVILLGALVLMVFQGG